MATLEEKQETARENGKKSHGPVTPEGKARSSRNAITHGLASKHVVMSFESEEKYDQHFKEFMDEWKPQSKSEFELVLSMVNSSWRIRRIWTFETALLDSEMFTQAEDFEAAWATTTSGIRLMDTVTAILATNPASLDVIERYETRYDRLYHRALDQMQKIRRDRGLAPIPNPELQRPQLPHPTSPTPPTITPTPETPATTPSAAWLTHWLHSIVALLQALLTHAVSGAISSKSAMRATKKAAPKASKTPAQPNEPTPFTATPLTHIQFPERFSWFTEFIPTDRRSGHKANN